MILFLISFVAGVLTVLAPCVLPLLPVIVGGSIAQGSRRRAYTICLSLGASVIVFTLLLKATTALIAIPQSFWNIFSGVILIGFGILMLFPSLWDRLGFVNLINRESNKALSAGYRQNSIWGDLIMGAALGPVFTSCSPTYFIILATVLPASLFTGSLDLLAYAVGLSGFLFIIAIAGQRLVDRLGITIEPTGWFRRGIGILFLVVGLGVATGAEARLEAWLVSGGYDLTFIEQGLLGAPQSSTYATSTQFLSAGEKAKVYPSSPELVKPDGYINTGGSPITIAQFKGQKVVLVDFWTYSCINCQREIPYLKAWYDKYAPQGLEIISVHTPEFAFEHVLGNVQDAVNRFGIKYPVVLDNEYQTWNAFQNQYWPRAYLVDIDGYIVYDKIGEGDYDKTEAAIQHALLERAQRLGLSMPTSTPITAPAGDIAYEGDKVQSPETYFGAGRNEYLANGKQGTPGNQLLTIPATISGNALYLGGLWRFEDEYAENLQANAQIRFQYGAKNVYIVAASPKGVKIKVTRDGGKPLGSERGADVDASGEATIKEDRLYDLVQGADYGIHTLEIQVEGPGLDAYTFTFG